MRVLIINFEMDPASPVLAWQVNVARQIAGLVEEVVVLTKHIGTFERPANMHVYTFPKLFLRAPLRWFGGKLLLNAWGAWICRKYRIDACFIHMNMEWSFRLALAFRLLNIPVLMWYAHGTVTDRLKLAHKHATRIVTSTPEGFRLPSDKVKIIGQGVDADLFTIQEWKEDPTDIITVGRVSPRKRIDRMVDVMAALVQLAPDIPFRLIVIGNALNGEDREYLETVRAKIAALHLEDRVLLAGHILPENIPPYYEKVYVHLNMSLTGSMDKTVMEALAAGCPVLTNNEAFGEVLRPYPQYVIHDDTPQTVARQLLELYQQRHTVDRAALRNIVVGKHDLATYGQRILRELDSLTHGK